MFLNIIKTSSKTSATLRNRHLKFQHMLIVLCALFYTPSASAASITSALGTFCLNLRLKAPELMRGDIAEDLPKHITIPLGWRSVSKNENRRGPARLIELTYELENLNLLEINAVFYQSGLRGLRGIISSSKLPNQLINFAPNCAIIETREINYKSNGHITDIRILKPDGTETTIPINPLPPKRPQRLPKENGPVIGHIDSGIDYLRPEIIQHLGFDSNQTMIGIDAWEGDDLPFDANFTGSAFYPQHHGSFVVDVLIQTGVDFTLLPARYPRNNMNLMSDVIKWMAIYGAQIVMLPLGSKDSADWDEFFKAAAAHPEILFIISAGNDGLDIGNTNIYPAVNNLPNALTVTSTLKNGEIANGSNYGTNVDIGLPAENLLATGVGGKTATKSGSSFAVPKLTAFAACTIGGAKEQLLTGEMLANKIKAELQQSEYIGKYFYFLSDEKITEKCAGKL
jgi:hypothetical protein